MENQKQTVAQVLKEANNVLVTVSANPSVDQLSACIGLTLALNKMGKHGTAVFSGNVPSTIEFLQPEKTLEKNTDSLRDFIIALDKSKADKLRYKVEDKVVKIFITPYKTSISDHDLQFSQGDFNVDVVIAIGVHVQADLDQAITAHGRILHDAKVITLNSQPGGELGTINWIDTSTSSLSEMTSQLVFDLDKTLVDPQIATAMLTGIVAETERFSNALTSPRTMSISAELMAAGANQQLVATKLQAPKPQPAPALATAPIAMSHQEIPEAPKKPSDGTLEITHDRQKEAEEAMAAEKTAIKTTFEEPWQADKPQTQDTPITGYDQEYKQETPFAVDPMAEAAYEPIAVPVLQPLSPEAPALPEINIADEQAPQINIKADGTLKTDENTNIELGLPAFDQSGNTSEEKALLAMPKAEKGIHKDSRSYLGNPSRRTENDAALLGMPDISPQPPAMMPDGTITAANKDPLTLPDLAMPLLDRTPLEDTHAAEADTPKAEEPAGLSVELPAPEEAVEAPKAEADPEVEDTDTLSDIEKEVNSPHTSGIGNYEPLGSDPLATAGSPATGGLSLPDTDTSAVLPAEVAEEATSIAPQPVDPMAEGTLPQSIIDSLGAPASAPAPIPAPVSVPAPTAATPTPTEPADEDNDSDIEDARDAVEKAIQSMPIKHDDPQPPTQSLNAQPLAPTEEIVGSTGIVIVPPPDLPESENHSDDAGAPPPIPPPLMPLKPGK